MADNEIGITFTGDISDISGKLDDLVGQLNSISSQTIDLTINADTSVLDQMQTDLGNIAPVADNTAAEVDKVSKSADNVSNSSSNASGSMNQFASVLGNVGGTSNSTINTISNLAKGATELGESMGKSIPIFGELSLYATELAAGIAVLAAEIGTIYMLADAAGQFQDSWLRLGQAIGETDTSIQDLQGEWGDAISTMKDETGRSASVIRNHIISMGIAGVTSKDLIIDSFEGIAGAAFVTGQSVDTIEAAFKRMVSTGVIMRRQLISLGINDNDILRATGMTLDQVTEKFKTMDVNARTALLSSILNMKYGADANEAYKMSWQHVQDALKAAWDYIVIIFGQLFLPIVVPVLSIATEALKLFAGIINQAKDALKIFGINLFDGTGLIKVLLTLLGPFGVMLWPIVDAVGWLATNWQLVSQQITRFIELIKAGEWGAAAQMMVDAFQFAMQQIYNYFMDLPRRIGELAGQFIEFGATLVQWIIVGLTSLDAWLTQELMETGATGASGMVDGFGKWLDDNFPKIVDIITKLVTEVAPKLVIVLMKLGVILAKALGDALKDKMKNLPNDMMTYGGNMIQGFIDGVKSKNPLIGEMLQFVADHFPASPPKTGPLSKITPAGMSGWIENIMSEGGIAIGNFMLGNNIPTPNPISSTSQSTTNAVTVHVNMGGTAIGSSGEAREVGALIGKSAAEKIASEALNMGVSTINYIRS